jgi:FtsP/CotA-like multicopper oxidase with cupredoxin domain
MKRHLLLILTGLTAMATAITCWVSPSHAAVPGGTPDYFATPNWANSPPLRKFVDTLPGLGATKANNLGQYIPVAIPDTATYPGSDYYEIEIGQYTEKMHTDLPPTTLRGYRQTNTADATVSVFHYLGPLIIAQKDRPVRVKFINSLPTGAGGNLFLPVDTTIMGAGEGPKDAQGNDCDPEMADCAMFTENRATLHLHGGRSPWISDGTPHQWITPAGENTPYEKGVSVSNVPDMWYTAGGTDIAACAGQTTCNVPGATNDPGPGAQTFYWTNQQSARLMFYHDHSWGITRLNVYAGEAAGLLLTDPTEQALLTAGLIPPDQIPLVIQDKTYVDAATIDATDPTWNWGSNPPLRNTGDLWWPHVYMPAQNPYNPDLSGINAMGRWMYGPWFWPPTKVCGTAPDAVPPFCIKFGPVPNPLYDPACVPSATTFCQPPEMPGSPNPSWGAEAFLDTPVVNGTAYPRVSVQPKAYRLRVLNAAHDRFFNLQLYKASSIVSKLTIVNRGSGYTAPPMVTITPAAGDTTGRGAVAEATITPAGRLASITLTTVGSGYTLPPVVTIAPPTALGGVTATATAVIFTQPKEVGMVPAAFATGFPEGWPTDGREGGVPDPATRGPALIQIATEGGFLPAPVLLPNQPVVWNRDPTMFNAGNVLQQSQGGGTLMLGPAERADVIVDFSNYAGQTLILYNDAPAPWPALDPHYDYYTGAPDRRDMGGYGPTTPPGRGPNTRTIMQIRVLGTGGTAPPDDYSATTLANLENAFRSTATTQGVFEQGQSPIIVGQTAYNDAYSTTFPATWPNWGISRISDTTLSFMQPDGVLVSNYPIQPKAMQDEMGEVFDDFGRMSAKIGLELKNPNAGNVNFIVQNYVDPPTEIVRDGVSQIWKITHNGVDTHPIHFHLFEVQVLNRVGWDGFIRLPDPNELGWKDTVRISPLEDTIVALRPTIPTVPFALPNSIRPLNPAAPLGSMMGFSQINPADGADMVPPTTNRLYDFGHEYVWHCHILSHEENDMMRSIVVRFGPNPPANLIVRGAAGPTAVLTWTDRSNNETGFTIERATDAVFTQGLTTFQVGANVTTYTDTTVARNGTYYYYRVFATNASGASMSSIVTAGPPESPSGLTAAQPTLGNTVTLYWTDNAPAAATPTPPNYTLEGGYQVQRKIVGAASWATIATLPGNAGTGAMTYNDTTAAPATRYDYRVRATNVFGTAGSNTFRFMTR